MQATIAQTWFTGWTTSTFPPEDVPWEKYSVVTFAFAVTTPQISDLAVAQEDDPTLRKLVQLGHANKKSVTLSIGGWTGSRYFSTAVATSQNRTAFANAIKKIVTEYDLDGVDIDWEYPNDQGIGCNVISTADTANYLEFLKQLRSTLKKDALITAATAIKPFMDSSGNPSQDVSEFAKYLSWIEIMNYDVWGSFSTTTGPVGPLNDTCVAKPSEAAGSAVSAVKAWTAAGFPKDQIVLGVPAYGYGYVVDNSSAFQAGSTTKLVDSYRPFTRPASQGSPSVDECGVTEPASAVYEFATLFTMGLLNCDGLPAHGIPNYFDSCAMAPSIYESGVWYEYDDPRSFKAKGEFILNEGLKGFAMWDAGSDYDDLLLDAICEGAKLGSS